MASTIFDVHINTLQVIENQLGRLHATLMRGDGDDDVTQEQISHLQDELVRLSRVLGEAEIKAIKENKTFNLDNVLP